MALTLDRKGNKILEESLTERNEILEKTDGVRTKRIFRQEESRTTIYTALKEEDVKRVTWYIVQLWQCIPERH